ncbi:hypothetical protein SAY87_012728 [Trapa incisa]|uniref:Uncharacterized protein n=1 Tax=Trapa incisa TaxID=236973 RepID=A0AAN7GLD8_9MYRT|nr:hypothetical protein SAY87_012728 [Trapa incisa]
MIVLLIIRTGEFCRKRTGRSQEGLSAPRLSTLSYTASDHIYGRTASLLGVIFMVRRVEVSEGGSLRAWKICFTGKHHNHGWHIGSVYGLVLNAEKADLHALHHFCGGIS